MTDIVSDVGKGKLEEVKDNTTIIVTGPALLKRPAPALAKQPLRKKTSSRFDPNLSKSYIASSKLLFQSSL